MVTSSDFFEATISVFNITHDNNTFSISTPGHWNSEDGKELINNLKKLLELRCEDDIDLHVKEVEKRGIAIEFENIGYKLAGVDHFKGEILAG